MSEVARQLRSRGDFATPTDTAPSKVSEETCPEIKSVVDLPLVDLQDPATELEIICQFSLDGGTTWQDGSRSTYYGDPKRTEPLIMTYQWSVPGQKGMHEALTRTLVRNHGKDCEFGMVNTVELAAIAGGR